MINQQNYSFHWLFISKNWSIFNLSNVEALMLSRLELKEKQERSWKKKKKHTKPRHNSISEACFSYYEYRFLHWLTTFEMFLH